MAEPERAPLVAAAVRAGVRDPRLLEAIADVPRREFVPAEQRRRADVDEPLPIAHGQVTTQPSLVAAMVEALDLRGDERVLEVGAGLGWQTALLARLAADVWTVERHKTLAAAARANLGRVGVRGAHVVVGDGTRGLPEQAPFDAIIVCAAFPDVPPPLVAQLADGGRLVQPIGSGGAERVMLFVARGGRLEERRVVIGARFVRLYGAYGF